MPPSGPPRCAPPSNIPTARGAGPPGQGGITPHAQGYRFYNGQPPVIRGGLRPGSAPTPHGINPLANVALYKEQKVWPIRPTPGINRGYIASFLRPDGTMIEA